MKTALFAAAAVAVLGFAAPALAGEVFVGAYKHDVTFIGEAVGLGAAGREDGVDIHLGYRTGRIECVDLSSGKVDTLYEASDKHRLCGPNDIVFDRHGAIDTVNPGATRILRQPLQAYTGRPMQEVTELTAFAESVAQRFDTLVAGSEPGEREQWQDSFELRTAQPGAITLLARGAMLPGDARLLVFDDITEVVSAQRAQAWAEVARRLAHEIKNPLTPIQLSAERLQHKLASRLEGADQAMLVRGVGVIVDQVEAMKQLVNEFRDYARLPSAQLHPLALNDLVTDVASLYGQAQEQGRLALALAGDLPDILGDAAQLRQVIHNLLQNALDAVVLRGCSEGGYVVLATEAVRGETDGAVTAVRLSVVDNGPGFEEQVLRRAFEPYVTTKPRGTGLGLAVVKKIADEHRARVRIRNRHEGDQPDGPVTGARVSISFFALAQSGSGIAPVLHP